MERKLVWCCAATAFEFDDGVFCLIDSTIDGRKSDFEIFGKASVILLRMANGRVIS
jgi:hypothetical protein